MGESAEYYIAKAKAAIKQSKKGLTNLDLVVLLRMNIPTWDKFKTILKDVPEIYWDKEEKKWVWSG
jgi:hypothetical protein